MFNILVIEDDIYQRENLKAMIEEAGAPLLLQLIQLIRMQFRQENEQFRQKGL